MRGATTSGLLSLLLLGCDGGGGKDAGDAPPPEDDDGDGYSPPADCDDTDETIHPDAPDTPYDGIDSDCAGDDDFDQDADGHTSADHGGDDCVDSNPDISPTDPEVPYDLADNDCDPSTPDDDIDGDGVFVLQDCDDQDPTAYPGALEVLGDGRDTDCDGLEDAAPFGGSDLRWRAPSRPRLVATPDGFVLAVAGDSVSGGAYFPEANAEVAVALSFDLDHVGGAPSPHAPVVWVGEFDDNPLSDVDVEVTATGVVLASAYYSLVNRFSYLLLQPARFQGVTGLLLEAPSFRAEGLVDFEQVDVALDPAGVAWMCAADDDTLGYARGDGTYPADGGMLVGTDATRGCFLEPGAADPMPFTTCADDGTCTTWSTDPDGADPTPVAAGAQPWSGEDWLTVRERAGVVTAVPEAGGVLLLDGPDRIELLAGMEVFDAEAVLEPDGTVWVAAVADRGSGNEVLIAYGDPDATLAEVWLPFVDPTREFAPTGATLALTADRVGVAVSAVEVLGGDDAVGWTFLGR